MSSRLRFPVNSSDHIKGNRDAILELVEYGDYECSDCGRAFPIIKKIQHEMGDDLVFIFRNFPFTKIHQHAVNAALAAEAAALQNKFWEMHDIIFKNQKQLEYEDLLFYAKTIKLDLIQFENDIQENALLAKIESDFEGGVRSGVSSTPTFFVNGIKYDGIWEGNQLLYYLKSQLTHV